MQADRYFEVLQYANIYRIYTLLCHIVNKRIVIVLLHAQKRLQYGQLLPSLYRDNFVQTCAATFYSERGFDTSSGNIGRHRTNFSIEA